MIDNELYKNIRSNFGSSFDDFISGKFDRPNEDSSRWTGFVIDNQDPEFRGRVKVVIVGKYETIPESSIPWAVPDIGYLGSKAGNFIVPENGTILRGYFDHGDIHKPVFDSVAFNQLNTTLNSQMVISPLDYPNKMILMQTDQGEILTLNRANGEVEFKHRSGTIITLWKNGTVNITTGESDPTNPGEFNLYVPGGNINIESDDGEINVTSQQGNITVNSVFGEVKLGKNAAMQLVNNLPNCLVTGAPHFVGNTNVKC